MSGRKQKHTVRILLSSAQVRIDLPGLHKSALSLTSSPHPSQTPTERCGVQIDLFTDAGGRFAILVSIPYKLK